MTEIEINIINIDPARSPSIPSTKFKKFIIDVPRRIKNKKKPATNIGDIPK